MKKEVCIPVIAFISVLFITSFASAFLGVSPAIREFNFIPNGEQTISYSVSSEDPKMNITFSLAGDLSQYVTLDKYSIIGGGTVNAKIVFPSTVSVPGKHKIIFYAKETPPKNVLIGSAIVIGAAIYVNVPYPGRYLDASLTIPNANLDEKIPVKIMLVNRGTEQLNVQTKVDFFDSNMNIVRKMSFEPEIMNSSDKKEIGQYLDSTGMKPGTYLAKATIEYGSVPLVINKTFKIGSLSVNITNYTSQLESGKVSKFIITINSLWNDNLKGVYADVNISNDYFSASFRTPSADLNAWEYSDLVSYLDTNGMEGDYNIEMLLKYNDQSSIFYGQLHVSRAEKGLWAEMKSNTTLMIVLILAIVAALTLYVVYKLAVLSAGKKRKHVKKRR